MLRNVAIAAVTTTVSSGKRFYSWAATHVGTVRTRNEDFFVNRSDLGVWAVADGAGGHQGGEIAAETIAQMLNAVPSELGPTELLYEARVRITKAHEHLRAEAARRGPGAMLATTLV